MHVGTETLPERYRDVERVAHGGMGEVYCATDALLGRTVAVKVLAERYAANDEIRKRFTREALAAARLSGDAGIVTIYDVGEVNGRPFIVMEYLPGGSLEEVLRREGAQPPERALTWLETTAEALDHAHEQGVVHRDVKPANLLLDRQGALHVADFGVASAAGLDSLTQTGTILGTAGYLAPEQAQGRRTSPASDRYALGVVAFELLAGTRPFQRESATAEASAHVHAPVPPISERGHGIPPEADAVFRRALAKEPADRFSSCGEFAGALRAAYDAATGPTRVLAPGAPRRAAAAPRPRLRVRLLLIVFVLALLAGGIAAALLATGGRHTGRRPAAPVTVTRSGTTVRETVTAQPSTSTAPTSTAVSSPSASPSAGALAQQGYQRLQAGDAAGALPLLQRAAQRLAGTQSLAEAYNDYNLAVALAKAQGCSPQVQQLLNASEAIQGHRSEISRLRKACARGGD